MKNGIVIVNKPAGITSHDVVSRLRRIYNTKRVGHTGTLDPMATGVLPVCIGNATRAADMLTASEKGYRAEFMLGMRTDTLDIEGEVTERADVNVNSDDIRAAVLSFEGEQKQIPPMYSAIKQNGRKLYELAREGIEVERAARDITIFSIDILNISLPYVEIEVHCSKGTYIRSLCDDIGKRLGCGAVMTKLTRIETAGFRIEESYTIDELEQIEDPYDVLIPTDKLFGDLDEIHLNEKQERSIVNGVRMTWRNGIEGKSYRLYGHNGSFLCVSRIEDCRLVLVKSFWG